MNGKTERTTAPRAVAPDAGVAEISAPFGEALSKIGTTDANGNTIGIVNCTWVGMRLFGLAFRLAGLLLLIMLYFAQQPFAWLPIPDGTPLSEIRGWEMFSGWKWSAAVLCYLGYFVAAQFQSSMFRGQSGAEIHLAKHKKIVRTVKPRQLWLEWDPRVYPMAAVSTRYFLLPMKVVVATTKTNITLKHRGDFLARVSDSYTLLVKGGFDNFTQQLDRLYASAVQEEALRIPATEFNQFLVDPVEMQDLKGGGSITTKLGELESTDLSVEFLTRVSEIGELDISGFRFDEPESPKRRAILPRLRQLADDYGIELVDYIPEPTSVDEAYLKTLAIPLVTSLTRLEQATTQMREIISNEIDEEIAAATSTKQLANFQIRKIITEIEAVTQSLDSADNRRAIVTARLQAMKNLSDEMLTTARSEIETLIETIRAKEIDTAGLERYFAEMQRLLDEVEGNLDTYVPRVGTVLVSRLSADEIFPVFDALGNIFQTTGTNAAIKALEEKATIEAEDVTTESIETDVNRINIEDVMAKIRTALERITADSGISTDALKPETVKDRIDAIAREVGVTEKTDEAATA